MLPVIGFFFSDQDSRSSFLFFPHKKVEDYIAVKEFSQTINEIGFFNRIILSIFSKFSFGFDLFRKSLFIFFRFFLDQKSKTI